MNLLIWIMCAYGITVIETEGSIFDKWRDYWESASPNFLGMLFTCPLCFSTWVGFILSGLMGYLGYYTPFTYFGINETVLRIFLDGVFTSGSVWMLHNIEVFLKKKN